MHSVTMKQMFCPEHVNVKISVPAELLPPQHEFTSPTIREEGSEAEKLTASKSTPTRSIFDDYNYDDKGNRIMPKPVPGAPKNQNLPPVVGMGLWKENTCLVCNSDSLHATARLRFRGCGHESSSAFHLSRDDPSICEGPSMCEENKGVYVGVFNQPLRDPIGVDGDCRECSERGTEQGVEKRRLGSGKTRTGTLKKWFGGGEKRGTKTTAF